MSGSRSLKKARPEVRFQAGFVESYFSRFFLSSLLCFKNINDMVSEYIARKTMMKVDIPILYPQIFFVAAELFSEALIVTVGSHFLKFCY